MGQSTTLLPALVIVLVSFSVYFPALLNGFVYDDKSVIVENAWIKDVRYLPDIFRSHVWGFIKDFGMTNYYRPMTHVVLMADYAVFGLRPWGFHLVNILFHAGISVLVFLLALRLEPEAVSAPPPAPASARFLSFPFIAALLFATHPIHVEPVAWVSAIMDLSFSFFYLLSLYCFMRYMTVGSGSLYAVSLLSFALALLSKEPAVTLPILFVVSTLALHKPGRGPASFFKGFSPFLVVLGLYVVARIAVLGAFVPVRSHGELSFSDAFVNIFPLFSRYLIKLAFPVTFNAITIYHPVASLLTARGVLSLCVTAAYAASLVIAWKRSRTAFFCLALIVVPLLPALYVPALAEASFAERFAYLPAAGFVMLIALLWARLRGNGAYRSLPTVLVLAVVCLYSLLALTRIPVWKDNLTLFTDTVRKSPEGETPRGMLGNALVAAGRFDEAIATYRIGLEFNPNSKLTRKNLAYALMEKGNFTEAIAEYRKLLARWPSDADIVHALAQVYKKAGMVDETVEEYRRLADLRPDSPQVQTEFGLALARKGLTAEAILHYEKAVALDPSYVDAHYNMATAYGNSGRMDRAIEQIRAVVKLRPDNAFYQNILGIMYGQMGEGEKAKAAFEEAVRLSPSEPAYRRNLEKAIRIQNKPGNSE